MQRFILGVVFFSAFAALSGCGIGDAQRHLRSAVDAKSQELDQCYAQALTRNRDAAGTLNANLHVGASDGRVDQVEFVGGDVRDPELQSCMTATLTQVQLPEPPAANLKVEYTFQLAPEG